MSSIKRLAPPILAAVLWILAASALQAQERPLLLEGKSTIFQRVITNAGARWYDAPEGTPSRDGIRSFTLLYVYKSPQGTPPGWLRCAANSIGRDISWVRAGDTTEFKSALTLMFSDRVNRSPQLFFKSFDDLLSVANEPDASGAIERYAAQFRQFESDGVNPPPDFPVVAMEPEEGAIALQDFYLMPIFAYDEGSVEGVKILQVASINPGSGEADGQGSDAGGAGQAAGGAATLAAGGAPPPPPPPGDPWQFGVAVLVDTTISMHPFIEQAKELTRDIYERISREGLMDEFHIALVAFRSSVEARPGVEYVTRVISDLKPASAIQHEEFEKRLEEFEEAKISTHSFAEDSMAGFTAVIEDLGWTDRFLGRYVVLITDAGPLASDDPYNATLHTPESMADQLKTKGFNVLVMHIKSQAGSADHANAERSYRTLAASDGGVMYHPIDDPETRGAAAFNRYTSEAFAYLIDAIKKARQEHERRTGKAPPAAGQSPPPPPRSLVGQPADGGQAMDEVVSQPDASTVVAAQADPLFTGELAHGQAAMPGVPLDDQGYYDFSRAQTHQPATGDEMIDAAARKGAEFGAIMGYSVMLRYLGALGEVKPPSVVKSWITDQDMGRLETQNRRVNTVQVAVVLTRNQLSALADHLRGIVENANLSMDTASTDFFNSIMKASTRSAVDPAEFSADPEGARSRPPEAGPDTRMSELSDVTEYLDDLPYKSTFMHMSQRDWYNMSAMEQDRTIRVVRSRIELYSKIYDDRNLWAKYSGVEGDWLYRMPLTMLP